MTDQDNTEETHPFAGMGSRAHEADAARTRELERQRWQSGLRRTHEPTPPTDAEIRAKLGPGARVVSSVGGTPTGGWERLAARAHEAQRDGAQRDADSYRSSAHLDPDDLAAENRTHGPAVSIAKAEPLGIKDSGIDPDMRRAR